MIQLEGRQEATVRFPVTGNRHLNTLLLVGSARAFSDSEGLA